MLPNQSVTLYEALRVFDSINLEGGLPTERIDMPKSVAFHRDILSLKIVEQS
jgi:hypothetical protein